jgi:hypothetical protein
LADTNDLDAESPEYFTDSFRLINELIDKAVLDPDDGQQIQTYLEGLSRADPSFKYRRGIDSNGNIIGYIWQKGSCGVISSCMVLHCFWTDLVDPSTVRVGH